MTEPPQVIDPKHPLVGRIRELCFAYPGVTEGRSWGRPTFVVTGRIFAVVGGSLDRPFALLVKVPEEERLARAQDSRFFVPAYWGTFGWFGIDVELPNTHSPATDWTEIAELLESSYLEFASARQRTALDGRT